MGEDRNSYSEMIGEIGELSFRRMLNDLIDSAEVFITEAGYNEHVQCNERIMLNVLLDYYADIFRLKDFHSIDEVRTEKVVAYIAAWIVKRKPLQFVDYTDDESDIFVNERFAVFMMLNECMFNGEKRFVRESNREKLDEYIDMILYYLKYRECNPQVLEMAIASFKMGLLVSEIN